MIAKTKKARGKRDPVLEQLAQRGAPSMRAEYQRQYDQDLELIDMLRLRWQQRGAEMSQDERDFAERIVSKQELEFGERVSAQRMVARYPLELVVEEPSLRKAAPNGKHTEPPADVPQGTATPATWSDVFDVDLALLDRHPDNRHPTKEDVAEKATSLQEDGQLEQLRIRRMDNGRFQILSGETRVLAGRQLGWPTMRAQAITCDDARALELLADYNGHRADLNPIQKAKLIVRLCDPAAKKGCGLTREQAGKKVGVESHSAASNLVRLLELPKSWQQRVEDGLPWTFARELLRVCKVQPVMQELEMQYADEPWESRDEVIESVDEAVDRKVRVLTQGKDYEHWYSLPAPHYSANADRRFELTDELRKRLKVQPLTINCTCWKGSKRVHEQREVEITCEVKLYDQLNLAAVKKELAAKAKEKVTKASREKKAPPKKLTPAEERQRKEKSAKQYRDRVANWRHAWLGQLVAAEAEKRQDVQLILLCWLAADSLPNFEQSHIGLAAIANSTAATFGAKKASSSWSGVDRSGLLGALTQVPKTEQLQEIAKQMALAVLTKEERDPRYTRIKHDRMDALAVRCGIDVADAWQALQRRQSPQLELFYELHNQGQLDDLAGELGVDLAGCKGKDAKVVKLLDNEGLKLPKCLKPLEKAAKKGGK